MREGGRGAGGAVSADVEHAPARRGRATTGEQPAAGAPLPPTSIEAVRLGDLFPTLPGGLSLAVALQSRTRRGHNALRRAGAHYFADIADLKIGDLTALRNVGVGTTNEIVAALAASEVQYELMDVSSLGRSADADEQLSNLQRTWSATRSLAVIAIWAATYLGTGLSIMEAIGQAALTPDPPSDVAQALKLLTVTPVLAWAPNTRTVTPGDVLDGWIEGLSDRDATVLRQRTLAAKPLTYEALGRRLGITAERVRQVEQAMLNRANHLFVPAWHPLGRTLASLEAATAPVAILATPVDLGSRALEDIEVSDAEVLARLSGRAEITDGVIGWPATAPWLTQIDEILSDAVGATEDEHERYALAESRLIELGIGEADIPTWMQRQGYVASAGTLATAPHGMADRAYQLLLLAEGSLTTEEVLEGLGVVRTAPALRRAMDLDQRIIRVGARNWTIAAEGRREYPGLRDAIGEALDEAGRPLTIAELLESLRRHYVVATHSVRVYAAKDPYTTVDGVVYRSA